MWRHPLAKLALKNTLWLAAGTGLSKFLKLLLIIVAARLLGAEEYGALTFAFGFVSLFIIFSDFGFSSIVTREFAIGGRTEKDFSALFSLKLILSLGTLILMGAGALFYPDLFKVILSFALAGLLSGIAAFFYSLFQARQQMKYQAWGTLFEAALVTALGFWVLWKTPSVDHLASVYLAGSAFSLLVVTFLFHRKIFPLELAWAPSVWKSFLGMAWPMAGVILFSTIYFDLNSVMLGSLGTLKETGWYNAGYRPVLALFIGLNLISVSFFPALSAALRESEEKWRLLWNVEFRLLFFLTIPIVVGGVLLAPQIVDFLYGSEFSSAVTSFQWALFTLGALALFIPFKDMLVAAHQQKKAFVIVLLGVGLNAGLNLFLIPLYGMKAAIFSTFIINAVSLLVAWIFTPRWIGSPGRYPVILKTAFISLLSAAVMGFLISRPAVLQFPLAMVVLTGATVYALCLFAVTKILPKDGP